MTYEIASFAFAIALWANLTGACSELWHGVYEDARDHQGR